MAGLWKQLSNCWRTSENSWVIDGGPLKTHTPSKTCNFIHGWSSLLLLNLYLETDPYSMVNIYMYPKLFCVTGRVISAVGCTMFCHLCISMIGFYYLYFLCVIINCICHLLEIKYLYFYWWGQPIMHHSGTIQWTINHCNQRRKLPLLEIWNDYEYW